MIPGDKNARAVDLLHSGQPAVVDVCRRDEFDSWKARGCARITLSHATGADQANLYGVVPGGLHPAILSRSSFAGPIASAAARSSCSSIGAPVLRRVDQRWSPRQEVCEIEPIP